MSDKTVLAVPSADPRGLEAARSAHFGQAAFYTLVAVDDGQTGEVTVVQNGGHEHGGCLTPVGLLAEAGATALIVVGIGGRPLAAFADAGVTVFHDADSLTVAEAVEAWRSGGTAPIDPAAGCGCGGH